jgi:Ni/Co efflux regulator RcnB
MTKEEAAMEAVAGNDNLMMSKMMMWAKNLLMVETFAVAEMMRVDMAATEVETRAMSAKRGAGSAEASSEMARSRVARVPRSPSRRNLGEKDHQEKKSDWGYGFPFHVRYRQSPYAESKPVSL